MEYGSIERSIRIGAAPEVVFDVVSSPEHVRQWWSDEADFESVSGGAGELVFVSDAGEKFPVAIQVVDAVPSRLFSFRWTHPSGESARSDNSFLVRFELEPDGDGTLLRMTETGFRERGWEIAVLEETYRDHEQGWDHHLSRLAPYVATYLTDRR
ncbi:SRPBCC domain-containing protein [Micromonospora sediminicola]|uniref:SRPBCC domain-containing protein n=1 Tax=Micromonospora sediminicola TaxID=946078 RepID=UPI0033D62C8B